MRLRLKFGSLAVCESSETSKAISMQGPLGTGSREQRWYAGYCAALYTSVVLDDPGFNYRKGCADAF